VVDMEVNIIVIKNNNNNNKRILKTDLRLFLMAGFFEKVMNAGVNGKRVICLTAE
jgi:hypothetical protein